MTETGGKILILGSTGFIGRALVAALGARAIPTVRKPVVGDPDSGANSGAPSAALSGAPLILDFMRPEPFIEMLSESDGFGARAAVIVAAEAKVDPCFLEPDRTFALNVEAPERLAKALAAKGIRPIFLSSEYVFDGASGRYTEAAAPNPQTAYGRQKLEAERRVLAAAPDALILRLTKILGDDPDDGTLLVTTRKQLLAGQTIAAATDQAFSPIFVGDLVRMIEAFVDRGSLGLFHIAGRDHVDRHGIVTLLAQTMDLAEGADIKAVSLDDVDFAEPRPRNLTMIGEKAIAETGIEPMNMQALCKRVAAIGQG
jgi:dTDP-4-dehydrorhamnose reductase